MTGLTDMAMMTIGPSLPPSPVSTGGVGPLSGAPLADVSAFEQALAAGRARPAGTPALQALLNPLEQIDGEASQLSGRLQDKGGAVQPLLPGELVELTAQCHQFMFHCQLVSTAASRTSDGLQQLFRQQS